jgi:FkbM family methyltransferase
LSVRTNGIVLVLRDIGRSLGVNRWIGSRLGSEGYEARYDNAFLAEIREGDIVWDVGANIGYYTGKIVPKVGASGSVVAFEPSPINFKALTEKCQDLNVATLMNCALGKKKGTLRFQQGEDNIGATSRIVADGLQGIDVEVCSGDELITATGYSIPNVIKIDVEGFELEVLQGMVSHLNSPDLRVIGIEVHFGLLKQRDMRSAPKQIEQLLNKAAFKVSWPDSSHLIAIKM